MVPLEEGRVVAAQCGTQWISFAMQGQENGKFRVHRLEAHIRKWHVRVQGVDALRRSCTTTTATPLSSIQALKQEHNCPRTSQKGECLARRVIESRFRLIKGLSCSVCCIGTGGNRMLPSGCQDIAEVLKISSFVPLLLCWYMCVVMF
jgi:hypothetical protein